MSCLFCDNCEQLTDTDDDPDSLYVPGWECLCKWCRDGLEEPSEFEAEALGTGLK